MTPRPIDPDLLAALVDELTRVLGADAVTTDAEDLRKASLDGAWMSPVIKAMLPLGAADVVARPADAAGIGRAVGAAARLGVPVTVRGSGTGNYGQAIPFDGGLVIETTRANAILEVAEGRVTAEAGASLRDLEDAAIAAGQQLWMYPSTVASTVGGFLSGGSGGTGTIAHGSNDAGFVLALDVAHATGGDELVHVEGEDAQPYVHNYGTAGVIARATVRLEPLQDWVCLYASFDDFPAALRALGPLGALDPAPRLVSGDDPVVAAALPRDEALPAGRASIRAILDPAVVEAARAVVATAGGRVEAERQDPEEVIRLSTLSYNHPIAWLQKANPGRYVHVEVSGDALVERLDEVVAVFEDGHLHIEAGHVHPIGMLAGVYVDPESVWAAIDALGALGVGVHNPHQWNVDFEVARTAALAATTDPRGLLNPGKLNPDYAGPQRGAIR